MNDAPRSYSLPKTNLVVLDLLRPALAGGAAVLDVGAGEGWLAARVLDDVRRRGLDVRLEACDLVPEGFRVEGVPCRRADLAEGLPYDDAEFDAAYAVEVLEHLEDPWRFLREARRVLRSGGLLVLTTPNVLSVNSRLRYLLFGFPELFDVLPLASPEPRHVAGHIRPTTLYALCHMAERCGFDVEALRIDRVKRSGAAGAALLWPLAKLAELPYRARLRRKMPRTYRENRRYLAWINAPRILAGRTVVLALRRR